MALLDYSLAHIRPSHVAAAAVYISCQMLGKEFPSAAYEIMRLSKFELAALAKMFVAPFNIWTAKSAPLTMLRTNYEKLGFGKKIHVYKLDTLIFDMDCLSLADRE